MVPFMLRQLAIGLTLGTGLLGGVALNCGPHARGLLAATSGGQLLALWLGAVLPFAVGYLATALCLCLPREED